uniref:Ig-like domain-containing protein n=1 Tax=Xiphophorus couchianus TaxID=32473 RepID=A0A3B5LHG1_9TELE
MCPGVSNTCLQIITCDQEQTIKDFTTCNTLSSLYPASWICVSGFRFHTAVAQPGEEVTLRCSNMSTYRSQVFWFKLDDGPLGCISAMLNAESALTSYDPFQPDKFAMTSDSTNVSLRIRPLDANDSGLYFCGYYFDAFPAVFTATYLKVEGKIMGVSVDSSEEPDGPEHLLNWILGGIVIFLIIVIVGFIVKIRILYAVSNSKSFYLQNLDSHIMNYAALSFPPKTKSNRSPVAERDLGTNVLYAATRQTH